MILQVNMYLTCIIELKTRKSVKSDFTRVKSVKLINFVKSVQFYEFTKFVI
jgi:hypothetical protein